MKRFIPLVCGLLLVGLGGCGRESILKMLSTPEDEAVAKNYIQLLQQGQYDQIDKDIDPKLKNSDTHDLFVEMRALIPDGEPVSVKVVGCNIQANPSGRSVNTTFEYQFPEKWLLINVAVKKEADVSTIIGFRVQPIPDFLERVNKFTFAGKSAGQYVMFALVCAVPLFTLYAFVACCRTKMKKRKWLWVLFIIFGVGELTVNWTTGQFVFVPLATLLFGASGLSSGYGPWMLSISLPLGAMVFLIKRRRIAIEGSLPEPAKVDPQTGKEEKEPYDY